MTAQLPLGYREGLAGLKMLCEERDKLKALMANGRPNTPNYRTILRSYVAIENSISTRQKENRQYEVAMYRQAEKLKPEDEDELFIQALCEMEPARRVRLLGAIEHALQLRAVK